MTEATNHADLLGARWRSWEAYPYIKQSRNSLIASSSEDEILTATRVPTETLFSRFRPNVTLLH
jgi:hypothetical protein